MNQEDRESPGTEWGGTMMGEVAGGRRDMLTDGRKKLNSGFCMDISTTDFWMMGWILLAVWSPHTERYTEKQVRHHLLQSAIL